MADEDNVDAGEDDKSTEQEGSDSHLHEDQKSQRLGSGANDGEKDKTQKLIKAGRDDFDPNAGEE